MAIKIEPVKKKRWQDLEIEPVKKPEKTGAAREISEIIPEPSAPVSGTLASQLLGAASGVTLNWGDELLGALMGQEARQEYLRQEQMHRHENPWSYLLGNLAGPLAAARIHPALGLLYGAAKFGPNLWRNVFQSGLLGAGSSAIAGAGAGDGGDQRFSQARSGALLGGMIGGGIPLGFRALESAAGLVGKIAVPQVVKDYARPLFPGVTPQMAQNIERARELKLTPGLDVTARNIVESSPRYNPLEALYDPNVNFENIIREHVEKYPQAQLQDIVRTGVGPLESAVSSGDPYNLAQQVQERMMRSSKPRLSAQLNEIMGPTTDISKHRSQLRKDISDKGYAGYDPMKFGKALETKKLADIPRFTSAASKKEVAALINVMPANIIKQTDETIIMAVKSRLGKDLNPEDIGDLRNTLAYAQEIKNSVNKLKQGNNAYVSDLIRKLEKEIGSVDPEFGGIQYAANLEHTRLNMFNLGVSHVKDINTQVAPTFGDIKAALQSQMAGFKREHKEALLQEYWKGFNSRLQKMKPSEIQEFLNKDTVRDLMWSQKFGFPDRKPSALRTYAESAAEDVQAEWLPPKFVGDTGTKSQDQFWTLVQAWGKRFFVDPIDMLDAVGRFFKTESEKKLVGEAIVHIHNLGRGVQGSGIQEFAKLIDTFTKMEQQRLIRSNQYRQILAQLGQMFVREKSLRQPVLPGVNYPAR